MESSTRSRQEIMSTLTRLPADKCLYALKELSWSLQASKQKLSLPKSVFESPKSSVFDPEVLRFVLSETDISKLNKTAIVKQVIDIGNVAKALGKHQTEITEKMYIGTIHGFCYALLKNFAEDFRDFRILDTVKSHHFITRYYKDCGMSDLGLELHPRNVILFLQCVDKMIDAFDESELWAENQKAAL